MIEENRLCIFLFVFKVEPSQIYGLNIQLPLPDGAMNHTDKFEVETISNIKVGESFEAFISQLSSFAIILDLVSKSHKELLKIVVNSNISRL